jgi:hypothetical protein
MFQDCETFILLQFEDVFIFEYLGILCTLGASNGGIESFLGLYVSWNFEGSWEIWD